MSDSEHLQVPEPVRRVEVFTGAGRRRRWTGEQKARVVAETYTSGETVCAVARRYALTQQQLFGWRRAARRQADGAREAGLSFASVVVQPMRSVAGGAAGSVTAIEIVIGAATVRVSTGADLATLQTVLHAVKAVS